MNMINYVKQNNIWDQKAEKLYEAQKLKSHYTELASKLSTELVELSGGQDSAGKSHVFHSHNRTGAIDYKLVPELKFVDLNKYRKEDIQVWKLENIGSNVLNKMGL